MRLSPGFLKGKSFHTVQKKMLTDEGVSFRANGKIDMSKYNWILHIGDYSVF